MRLSNEQKETIITFDETPADAQIFTYSRTWQKQIEKKLGIQPTFNNGFGGREYHIPKKRIRMPQPPRIYSPEQRQKMAKRLAARRPQKPLIRAGNTAAVGSSAAKRVGATSNTASPQRHQKSSGITAK